MELVHKGRTEFILEVFLQNNAVTTGAGLAGLLYTTPGLTAYYHRNTDAAPVAITLVTMTVGTWASGGFVEVDGTHLQGAYQIGIPNAALVAGADSVTISIYGATGLAQGMYKIRLSNFDLQGTGAELTSLASATNLATAQADLTIIKGYLDTEMAAALAAVLAIKAVTDNLPNSGLLTSLAQASDLATAQAALNAIVGYLNTEMADALAAILAVKNVTDNLPDSGALSSLATALNLAAVKTVVDAIKATTDDKLDRKITEIMTTAMTESYAADGVAPTPAQMMFMTWSWLVEKNKSGVTITCKKLDGTTVAMTFILDSATVPATITRTT